MKIECLIAGLVSFLILHKPLNAQEGLVQKKYRRTEFSEMNNQLGKGWNTWHTKSILCHVLLPESFAVNLQLISHQSGDTLKSAIVGRKGYGSKENVIPGLRSYDGSYTELIVEWQGISVKVQSAAKDKRLYLLITPIKYLPGDSLLIKPEMLWGRQGTITLKDGRMLVNTPSGKIDLSIVSGQYKVGPQNLKVSLSEVIAISSDALQSTPEIETIMNALKAKNVLEGVKYKGEVETYNAIHAVLAWNTVYDSMNKRIISPVSRNWSPLGWVLFGWDNYFAAYMLSLDNKDLAYANAIAVTKEITKNGFIPNNSDPSHKSEDRSEPQVGSLMVREIYRKYRETWFLEEVFDELLSWNRWRAANRDIDGYLVYGSDPYDYGKNKSRSATESGKMKAAKWESGMDNSPMWDDAAFDTTTHRMLLADVGLMSLYIADCRSLSEIAAILGKKEIVKELTERAEKYSKKLATLWNDEFGLYLNKDLVTGKFSYRLSPTLFYPMLAKVPNQQQASRMIKEHFYNPNEFWGEFIMPTIARNDSAYKDNKYWRGRIWAPVNMLVYMGLRNYQLPEAQKDMAEKSNNLLLKSWIGERHVYENYNAENGRGDDAGSWSDAFYHWGALLGFIDLIDKGFVPSPQSSVKNFK
jgi:glycogen debranching enzyme